MANEAQNSIGILNAVSGADARDIGLTAYGTRPRGVKTSPTGSRYAITMEASGTLLEMDEDFKVVKAVPTGAGPSGLAFDRTASESLSLLQRPESSRCFRQTRCN